jgi:hypothetical protein
MAILMNPTVIDTLRFFLMNDMSTSKPMINKNKIIPILAKRVRPGMDSGGKQFDV